MCLNNCIKFIVFAFNLLFVLAGIGLITIGVLYKIDFTDITDAIPDTYANIHLAPILTIVVGCIIFVISFLGCWGAIVDSSCLLTTYAVILLTIFILQVALGIFAFLQVNDTKDLRMESDRSIEKLFSKYQQNETREVVDLIQQNLKCCGLKGPSYWPVNGIISSISIWTPNFGIPRSCYPDNDNTKQLPYQDGCQDKFYDFLQDSVKIIGIVVLSLSAIEVVGAILSLCLSNSIRNETRRGRYNDRM